MLLGIERIAQDICFKFRVRPELARLLPHELAGEQEPIDIAAPDVEIFVGVAFQRPDGADCQTVVAAAVLQCAVKALPLAILAQAPVVEEFVVRADVLVIVARQNDRHTGFRCGFEDRGRQATVDCEGVHDIGSVFPDHTGHAGLRLVVVDDRRNAAGLVQHRTVRIVPNLRQGIRKGAVAFFVVTGEHFDLMSIIFEDAPDLVDENFRAAANGKVIVGKEDLHDDLTVPAILRHT